ncbi:hypothetical protein JAAARDRAFT_144624 [Jaapia argillacea MUCL 33604]|uniref:Uncharacterized protein n=1 Tax=Jaapia argillacea MUCL 33604 TaxID=933084 RepID=A0A067QKU9_9AGAM|nr:hypothetical protein JAAARDRAFT_144624 [Jaapia argillacea MUCL 33604]
MSSQNQPPYPTLEQDQEGTGDDLPTYDDLAAKSGPNSRFGRWKGWVEKRAAERYADVTREDRVARRARGWDIEPAATQSSASSTPPPPPFPPPPPPPIILNEPQPQPPTPQLRLLVNNIRPLPPIPIETPVVPEPPSPAPLVLEPIAPTHLTLSYFGSRFLPHTTAPIRALLPLPADRLLLIGHDDGLSVLDMYPQEWAEYGLVTKGPSEAAARSIWVGEAVYQLSLLEVESTDDNSPQGVVLALVGLSESDSPREQDNHRTLRMYNLSSLISLAKWAIAQKGARPLDLRRPARWHPQTSPFKKGHGHSNSIAKGIRSLITESPITPSTQDQYIPLRGSTTSLTSTLVGDTHSMKGKGPKYSPHPLRDRDNSASSSDSSWDLVDDLPLRWATDYVSLASPGTRLSNSSVLSFDVWKDENRRSRSGALLAIATKSNILVYQTPKGERVFKFIKEFYTPLAPRSLTFIQQSFQETVSRSPTDAGRTRVPSFGTNRAMRRSSTLVGSTPDYGTQLCLFVVFDKKAGIIRVGDAAVGEVEMFESRDSLSPTPTGGFGSRRGRNSMDGSQQGFTKEIKGGWIPPTQTDIPISSDPSSNLSSFTQGVSILTRGKQTHILRSPLPADIPRTPPIQVLYWKYPPKHVTTRVCYTCEEEGSQPFLQLVGMGDEGVEVLEVWVSSLNSNGEKGKGRAQDPVRAHVDLGGDVGYLSMGGHWDRQTHSQLERSDSTSSFDSLATEDIVTKLKYEQGIYGWVRKGTEDWRVFWVGGVESPLHSEAQHDV